MRQRINTNKVCSSDKYEESHLAHKNMLERNHQAFMATGYKCKIKTYYTPCQGKLIKVPTEKVESFKKCGIPLIEK